MHPAPRRHPRLKTQRRHVTAKRPVRNRERTRSNEDRPPRYVPPTLRGGYWTPWRSQLHQASISKDWRDPPPHKDLPQSPRPSDSPDWRAPSPNCPASFRNPSPLPQSPPPSPISPPQTLKALPTPQLHPTKLQAVPELILIIKTASNTLQGIIRIAEKLIHQVNAERRLAHGSRRIGRSSREDTLGNLGCSQPPKFPSWRGAPVTGSPEVSGSIA